MKRPPGLWMLLSAGVLWLCMQDVYGIRATALIFGKSSTSTTTEATSSVSPEENVKPEATNNTDIQPKSNGTETANSTRPPLTGNPQIDYIWDPNLPKELNGYNLSEYPFYERVPELLDFKCDGLHDGFYASVPHKCQVYHHCLFGTRYDFLCANYTAFDQKTFICQFVSEVDCVNSKNFWHRNDALYQAQSTTTSAPVNLKAAIYTTAPPNAGDPITPQRRPTRRPGGGFRRPRPGGRRRPPPVEYYDDDYYDDEYYEERPIARPRPRPRPIYDDEYDEYEDQRPEHRRANGRKRPYKRRNQDRRKPQSNEDEEVDDRFEDEDFVAAPKRVKSNDRRKRPIEDDEEEGTRGPKRGNDRKPSRKRSGNRPPIQDDEEDDLGEPEDSRENEQRTRKRPKGSNEDVSSNDGRPIIKPATGTIYDRPRVAPKINLPVPKNAADKYAYKGIGSGPAPRTTTTESPLTDEEYDDDEVEPERSSNERRKPPSSDSSQEKVEYRPQPSDSRQRTRKPDSEESAVDKTTSRPKHAVLRNNFRPSSASKRKPPASQEYEDEEYLDDDKEVLESRPLQKPAKRVSTSTSTTTSTTTPTPEPPRKEPVMRIIKRPFLPSRGGNPYSSRGLQPVGLKAVDKSVPENESQESRNGEQVDTSKEVEEDYIEEKPDTELSNIEEVQNVRKPFFKPSPVLIKVPTRAQYTPPTAETQELINPESSRQQSYKTKDYPGPRTTQRPKVLETNPLDLNEYDVTLNDALNPTLPNLPVRSFPTGFSSGSDYGYTNAFSRPRYVLEPVISPSSQNFVFPNKRSQQRYEAVPQGQYTTINRGYRQQQPQHAQTQAIYSGY